MLKIDIVSGFLGAGKTTFIKRLLNTRITNEKLVLIENEFGEVSVDSDFLADAKIDIKELSQGCICCSLAGDFASSLNEVIERFNPERILIEPSGVGKLSDVKNAISEAGLAEYLNSFVCIVDAVRAKMYAKNFGEFFADQIKNASTVILSRTDVAKEDKILQAIEVVRGLNSECEIVSTPISELDDDALFNAYEGVSEDLLHSLLHEHHHDEECCCGHHHEHEHHHDEECCCGHHHEHEHHHDEECCCGHHHEHEHHHDEECCCGHHHEHEHHHDEECCCGHHHEHEHHHDEECSCGHHHEHEHHHHADEVFQTVGIESAKTYDLELLKKVLHKLAYTEEYGVIVRAKGIIKTNEGWKQFNLSPEEYEVVNGNPIAIGKICVIGSNLAEHNIKELF